MDLSDALGGDWPGGGGGGGGNNQGGGGGAAWPGGGQPNTNPTWPGNSGGGPGGWPAGGGGGGGAGGGGAWPSGGGGGGAWPSGGGQTWPAGPQPSGQPGWPSQPSQPSGGGGQGGGAWPSPSPGPGPGPTAPSVPSVPSAPQQSLKVPYGQTLPNGVYNNLLITIVGTVKPGAKMFTIDLSTGRDLAFHLNPRFNEYGKQVIVRNSEIGKKWGSEERELGHFPFTPGKKFELKILCTHDEFKVAANGSHLLAFKHRLRDLKSINAFSIYNDVTLTSVDVDTLH